jgi:ATP-binding cassette subfamily F protein uup
VEKAEAKPVTSTNSAATKKLSFKEKEELKTLDKEIPTLQNEKVALETKMSSNISYDEIQKLSLRVNEIIAGLDVKEMRWLQLSE